VALASVSQLTVYPIIIARLVRSQMNGSVKEPNMFHNYETEKITRKASDAAENLQLYRDVRFFHGALQLHYLVCHNITWVYVGVPKFQKMHRWCYSP